MPREVYHSGLTELLIDNGSDDFLGFIDDVYYDQIEGAVPMDYFAYSETMPEGFALPDGGYSISVGSSESSVTLLMILIKARVFAVNSTTNAIATAATTMYVKRLLGRLIVATSCCMRLTVPPWASSGPG